MFILITKLYQTMKYEKNRFLELHRIDQKKRYTLNCSVIVHHNKRERKLRFTIKGFQYKKTPQIFVTPAMCGINMNKYKTNIQN